ncbi:MAG: GC-type dockerin domain-anchored protein [Phycisphaerales bacterium JB039]
MRTSSTRIMPQTAGQCKPLGRPAVDIQQMSWASCGPCRLRLPASSAGDEGEPLMNSLRVLFASFLLGALNLTAPAQVHKVAFELDVADPLGADKTDTAVAVSKTRVLVATNQRLQLFDRAGTLLDEEVVDTAGFPLQPTVAGPRLFDPRVEYDPGHDRLWIMYTQQNSPIVHLGVSKAGVTPQDLSATYWHYWTGSGANGAFILDSPLIDEDLRFQFIADHPTFNVDDDYLYLAAFDFNPGTIRDAIVVFPLTHSGGSMLSGARPSEAELDILQVSFDPILDDSYYRYAVQEPHEEVADVQFFLSTAEPPIFLAGSPGPPQFPVYGGVQTAIRLGGAYRSGGVWQYQWEDLPLPQDYFNPNVDGFRPATPDPTGWEVNPLASFIDSGVLARDVNGEFRVFTGQHVLVAAGTPLAPVDETQFRWYVIDPDLANFPGPSWAPSIEVVGIAPAGITDGETHQGVISVSSGGIAFAAYTKSGPVAPSGWPALYRSRLVANYTGSFIETLTEQGPTQRWTGGSILGGDFADIQPDPLGCGFWAVGTLVGHDTETAGDPIESDLRAIWLTEIPFGCNNAEMNGDGTVDETDLVVYSKYHSAGDPVADLNRDGKVDTLDFAKYLDEYAKR